MNSANISRIVIQFILQIVKKAKDRGGILCLRTESL